MKSIVKTMWLFTIVFITIYAIDLPTTDINIYKLIFPIIGFFIFWTLYKNNMQSYYFGETCNYSKKQWTRIFLWGIVLSIFNSYTLKSEIENLIYILSLICVIYVYSYYFNFDSCRKIIKSSFFIISIIIGISGVYESITGNYYHLTYSSYEYNLNTFGLHRPNTIFYNVNDNAVFSLFSLIIAFLLADECKHRKLIQLMAVLVFGLNIIMVDSRGAEVGFVFCIVFFYLKVNIEKKNRYLMAFLSAPIILLICRFFIEMLDISKIFQLGDRENVWENSLKSLRESYFLGVGPGNISLKNANIMNSTTIITAVHNLFLEILCDYGVLGLIFFVCFIAKLIKKAYVDITSNNRMLIAFLGLIALLLCSVTSSSLMGKSWFACFIGIIVAEINYKEISDLNNSKEIEY